MLHLIGELNRDPRIDGILVQSPPPPRVGRLIGRDFPGSVLQFQCSLGCGFIITFFYDIIAGWFGPAEQLPIQLLWVVIAVPVTAFGCSLYQTADLGVAPYDSLALALQDHLHKPYFGCRVFTDALCAAITFLLGGLVGIGTLVCAFGLGPFIQFFNGAFSEKVLQYKPVETS